LAREAIEHALAHLMENAHWCREPTRRNIPPHFRKGERGIIRENPVDMRNGFVVLVAVKALPFDRLYDTI